MDSRIEELACIIVERCNGNISESSYSDRAETYKEIKKHAMEMHRLLQGYRDRNPQEYE